MNATVLVEKDLATVGGDHLEDVVFLRERFRVDSNNRGLVDDAHPLIVDENDMRDIHDLVSDAAEVRTTFDFLRSAVDDSDRGGGEQRDLVSHD